MSDDNTPRIEDETGQEAPVLGGAAGDRRDLRILIRALLAIALFAVVLFVASGPVTLFSPRLCASCHTSSAAYESWKSSPHAAIACQTCHTDRAVLGGVGNSFALAADVSRTIGLGGPANASVNSKTCLSCHPAEALDQPAVVNGLRMSHKGLAEAGYRCTDCHANATHKVSPERLSTPTMSTCARCHNNVRVSGKCTTCHTDSGTPDLARRADPEWSKTHGSNWRELHGMGDLSTCSLCHKSSECQKCHGVPLPHDTDFVASHGTLAKTSKQKCLTCHAQSFCDNCHGVQIPHPANFLEAHPKIAKGYEDPRCQRCHIADDCSSCHQQHTHPHGPGIGR